MYLLQVEDEAVFPSKIGGTFPRNFLSIAKLILKRLFRVYAHVYHQHFKEVSSHSAIVSTYYLAAQVVSLGEEAHVNTSLKHFIYFIKEFDLIDSKELAPLHELIGRLTGGM